MKQTALLTTFFLFFQLLCHGQNTKTENLIIVTLDGFRWQELFSGADSSLLFNKEFTHSQSVADTFWNNNLDLRRKALMPFMWNVVANEGQLYGNRNYDNEVNCANPYWFSYPGYSEMLTGIVDRHMASNRKVTNPNTNVLEFIQQQPEYNGRVAAFSTWDVIPYIIRSSSNGIFVNTNEDRSDESTFKTAFNYLQIQKPKVMFLSLDGTDAHSHGGRYGHYLSYARKADQMISEIWTWMQSQECYKDKTTLIVTTDHGRGKGKRSWKTHGRWAAGSNQMWMAVMGPDTPALGEMKSRSRYYQKQIAKTAATFLNLDYGNELQRVGGSIPSSIYSVNAVSARD